MPEKRRRAKAEGRGPGLGLFLGDAYVPSLVTGFGGESVRFFLRFVSNDGRAAAIRGDKTPDARRAHVRFGRVVVASVPCLKFAAQSLGYPVNDDTCHAAAFEGRLDVLEFLSAAGFDVWTWRVCMHAARGGHFDLLRSRVPWQVQREWQTMVWHYFYFDWYLDVGYARVADVRTAWKSVLKALPWRHEMIPGYHLRRAPVTGRGPGPGGSWIQKTRGEPFDVLRSYEVQGRDWPWSDWLMDEPLRHNAYCGARRLRRAQNGHRIVVEWLRARMGCPAGGDNELVWVAQQLHITRRLRSHGIQC